MALTRYEGSENQGGVCQLRILKRSNFPINQVILQRYRGEGFIKISANDTLENVFPINYFTHFVAEHKQPSSRSQHGHYNEQGFTFSLSKDRPDILAQITQLQDEPLVILFKNNNHNWKVVGTEEDWAMIEVAQETGTRPSDTNQYLFDVKCASRYLSPFLIFEVREVLPPPEPPVIDPPPPEPPVVEPPPEDLSNYCFENPDYFFHTSNPATELRANIISGRFDVGGRHKISLSTDLDTRVIIRYISSSAIIDDRTVKAGEREYSFITTRESFVVIVEQIKARSGQLNRLGVSRPC